MGVNESIRHDVSTPVMHSSCAEDKKTAKVRGALRSGDRVIQHVRSETAFDVQRGPIRSVMAAKPCL